MPSVLASDGNPANPFAVNDTSFAGAEPSQATLSSDIPSVVPEPGSLILLGTGIVGIAGLLRIRKRRLILVRQTFCDRPQITAVLSQGHRQAGKVLVIVQIESSGRWKDNW